MWWIWLLAGDDPLKLAEARAMNIMDAVHAVERLLEMMKRSRR